VGTWPPEELEVLTLAVPVAVLPTQPQGSGAEVGVPALTLVVVTEPALDDAAEEALVPEAAPEMPVK
jgi:hypothetical protein